MHAPSKGLAHGSTWVPTFRSRNRVGYSHAPLLLFSKVSSPDIQGQQRTWRGAGGADAGGGWTYLLLLLPFPAEPSTLNYHPLQMEPQVRGRNGGVGIEQGTEIHVLLPLLSPDDPGTPCSFPLQLEPLSPSLGWQGWVGGRE